MGDIARHYPAEALRECALGVTGTLVDVGGGAGHLIVAALREHPELTAVLYEQPHVLPNAEAVLRAAGIRDRVTLLGGDFFAEVPAGGDLYVLSMITHDWADDDVARILANVRRAMTDTARLILLDAVLPAGDTPHRGKMIDVVMLALHPGRERTAHEFEILLSHAGLRLLDIRLPTSPVAAVIAEPRAPASTDRRALP